MMGYAPTVISALSGASFSAALILAARALTIEWSAIGEAQFPTAAPLVQCI